MGTSADRLTARLTAAQRDVLAQWLPGADFVADLSWAEVGTAVLEVRWQGGRFVVKAHETTRHLMRELRAHRDWVEPLSSAGRAPQLVHADAAVGLLITRYLPGRLVQGDPAERDPHTYREAGALLARFHGRCATVDALFMRRLRDETLAKLDRPHRIPLPMVERLRAVVERWPNGPVTLVPTHGDWGPRNWLVHDGEVAVIDFGRAALRPAAYDLVQLASRWFRGRPDLEQAFLDGYGDDPREPGPAPGAELGLWPALRLEFAVGTAVWAFATGDEELELEGRRGIDELLTAEA